MEWLIICIDDQLLNVQNAIKYTLTVFFLRQIIENQLLVIEEIDNVDFSEVDGKY